MALRRRLRRAGSRRAPRARPRAAPRWARACPPRAGSRARACAAARASTLSAWRSDQANTSTATAALPSPTAASAAGPRRPARRAATFPTAAAASIGVTRCEPQRSCSLSCVGGVRVALVAGDRLVLHAVVRGQVAAAQRHQRGHHAHAAPPPPRGPTRARARRADGLRRRARAAPIAPSVRASCIGSRAAGSARLTSGITAIASASLITPRTPGIALGHAAAQARLAPRGHLDLAGVGRARPPPSASARARAGRCAAPSRRAAACPRAPAWSPEHLLRRDRRRRRAARPRSSTGTRSSAPCMSGMASKRSILRCGKKP